MSNTCRALGHRWQMSPTIAAIATLRATASCGQALREASWYPSGASAWCRVPERRSIPQMP